MRPISGRTVSYSGPHEPDYRSAPLLCLRSRVRDGAGELIEFEKAVDAFTEKFPLKGSVLEEAFRERLSRDEERHRKAAATAFDEIYGPVMCEPGAFIARMRNGVELLRTLVAGLRQEEGGRGRDSNRAADKLMTALAGIWREHTGSDPGQGGDPYDTNYRTPFERFVDACFLVLPQEYRPDSVRYLTRKMNRANSKKES